MDLGDLQGPVAVEGSARFNGEAVTISAALDDAGVLTGAGTGSTPARLDLKSRPVSLAFDGTAEGSGGPAAKGDVDISVPSTVVRAWWQERGFQHVCVAEVAECCKKKNTTNT